MDEFGSPWQDAQNANSVPLLYDYAYALDMVALIFMVLFLISVNLHLNLISKSDWPM